MSAQLSTKLTLDGTQHNDALRGAAKELSKYKREVASTDKQLKLWKQQASSATGAINAFGSAFKQGNIEGMLIGVKGATGGLTKGLGALGAAFGIAQGATEVFNKVLHSSQTIEDAFGETQAQVTTVVDNFFSAISTGDFSSFINGMDNMVGKAREAYQAMDDLWNMAQSFSVQNARLNNKFQANLIEIRQKKGSKKPEDKKRVAALTAENQKIIQQQARGGMNLYNQTIKGLQKEIAAGTGMSSNITEGAIYRIVENDINNLKSGRAKYDKEYKAYLAKVEEMDKQAGRNKGRYFMGKTGVNYQNDLKKLQKQYGESIAANYLLQRKSDEELQQFNDKLKQGLSYQGTSLANQSKMLRYTKEMNATSGTGGGKRTGTPTPHVDENIGIIPKINNEIKELNKQKERATSIDDIKDINTQLENLAWRLDMVKKGIDPDALFKNLKPVEISAMPKMNLTQTPDLSKMKLPEIKVPTISEQYDRILDKISAALEAYDMGIISSKQARQYIDGFNNEIESIGLKPIKVEVETEGMKKMQEISKNANSIFEGFSGIDNVVNNIDHLKDAFEEGANSWEIFMGALQTGMSIIQAVSSVMQAMNTIQELLGLTATETAAQTVAASQSEAAAAVTNTAAKSGEAIAGATASGAKMPFPFNLVAIAAGVAAVIAALGMITGAFADGGIIGGNSYHGDKLLARVNSGEMILNGRQQQNLFNAIDGNRLGSNGLGGEVVFTIKGSKLQGVLHNREDKMNKIR